MSLHFIPARPEQAHSLSLLRQAVWQSTYRGIYPDHMLDDFDYAFHDRKNLACIRDPRFAVFFLEQDGETLGYLILRLGEALHLQSLYLVEHRRRQGFGRLAMDFVSQYAREHGCDHIFLDCHPDNTVAVRFYRHMGGVIIATDLGHEHNEENGVTFRFTP